MVLDHNQSLRVAFLDFTVHCTSSFNYQVCFITKCHSGIVTPMIPFALSRVFKVTLSHVSLAEQIASTGRGPIIFISCVSCPGSFHHLMCSLVVVRQAGRHNWRYKSSTKNLCCEAMLSKGMILESITSWRSLYHPIADLCFAVTTTVCDEV